MEKIGAFTDRTTDTGEWRPGNPATGQQATPMLAAYFNMLQRELVNVVDAAGLNLDVNNDGQLLSALQAMGLGTGQFHNYSPIRTYSTGEVVRGSDGRFYEFYDRDLVGTVSGIDPTVSANRPHIWMEWHGVRPGTVIEWRSATLPEGYIENDGATLSRAAYRRIFSAFGTNYGAGDGSKTFRLPDDRGEFKRGWDHGRGVDNGRGLGSWQADMFASHRHSILSWKATEFDHTGGAYAVGADAAGTGSAVPVRNDTILETGGNETRPRNLAVIYLTKI